MTKQFTTNAGAVNINSTPKVQHTYSEMSGGANHSRLTGIVCPDGKTLSFNYASGLDDAISRLSSISDTSGTPAPLRGARVGTLTRWGISIR